MQQRIDELKGRLELLRREAGEVEVLIQAYENAQKEQRKNGEIEKEKTDPVDAQRQNSRLPLIPKKYRLIFYYPSSRVKFPL